MIANLYAAKFQVATLVMLLTFCVFEVTGQELISNGDFESGSSSWYMNPSSILRSNTYPHSGVWNVVLGSVNNARHHLSQTVTIPSNATSATLSFFLSIATQESQGSRRYDSLIVRLRDTGGNTIVVLDIIGNELAYYSPFNNYLGNYMYRSYSIPVNSNTVGTARQVNFYCETDPSSVTSFGIDDVSLTYSAPPVPSIQVSSPNGGERWEVGESKAISWSGGSSSTVKIEYSTDNGSTWNIITSTGVNNGSYSWVLPGAPTNTAKVRVTENGGGGTSDVSNSAFTIAGFRIVSPNGGEIWQVGTTQPIRWYAYGGWASVDVYYSTNGGGSWTKIGNQSALLDGLQTRDWVVPNTPSTSCLVKVADGWDQVPSDVGDNVFTITNKPYLAGELRTKETFRYGRFEVRMKPASGSGIVSSFFTYHDSPDPGADLTWNEIDIEFLGRYGNLVQLNTITPTNFPKGDPLLVGLWFDPYSDFHVYAVEWTPDEVVWKADGQVIYRRSRSLYPRLAELYREQKIMMNIWPPGDADWAGTLDEQRLPANSTYDWVKYYTYTPGEGDGFTFQWEDNFSSWNDTYWQKAEHTFDGNNANFDPANVVFQDGRAILSLTNDKSPANVVYMTVDSESLSFGTVTPGSSRDEAVTIKNESRSVGTLTGSVSVSGIEFSIVSGGGSYTLLPGQSRDVTVKFAPPSAGSYTGMLSIAHNGTNRSSPVAVSLTGSSGAIASIRPECPDTVAAGSEFWLDIKIGDPNPVTNLFGLSFDLLYTNTAIIDYVASEVGPFLGSDVVFYPGGDDANGKVSIGISRKAPAGGVNGSGVVARLKFRILSTASSGTIVTFALSAIKANDPSGSPISLSPSVGTLTIISGAIVWPGDTNNDGKVDQADILPIGLYWGFTGLPRPNASTTWTGQNASWWTPRDATYADANGDGVVNQADVLPIGQNWSYTHPRNSILLASQRRIEGALGNAALRPVGPSSIRGRTDFVVDVVVGDNVNPVSNLFGISFVLDFASSKSYVQVTEVTQGTFLGADIIFFAQVDNNAGSVSIGMSRKAGQGAVAGTGALARVKMRVTDPTSAASLVLSTRDIKANDPNGGGVPVDPASSSILVSVGEATALPREFNLLQNFPNPFNPTTQIGFELPKDASTSLIVYNTLGQEVARLVEGRYSASRYNVTFDAGKLSAGMYVYVLNAGEFTSAKTMVLLK